jgi:diguanylate cyclase (GGDEF)-like protein
LDGAVRSLEAMAASSVGSQLDLSVGSFRQQMRDAISQVAQARAMTEVSLGTELEAAKQTQSDSWPALIAICGTALLMGLLMAWRLARHLIRPIHQLRSAANRFATGDLDHRIQTNRPDELGELARAFDSMAGQIEGTHRELALRAVHDALTGLPNRVLLADRIAHALRGDQRRGGRSALLMIDIDDFKRINDGFGHEAGDEAIKIVGQRLSDLCRKNDTVARVGGDEFAVLLEAVETQGAAVAFAQRALEDIRKPSMVRDRETVLEASVGVVLVEDGQLDEQAMMRRADLAMYAAKAAGKDRLVCFSLDMEQAFESRLVMEHDLRSIIEKGSGMFMEYQPIVDLGTRRMVGAEALMRMRHPQHGVLPPATFIMVAEESGLITSLTRWALTDACSNARSWTEVAARGHLPYVSVNLSARQLDDPRLVSHVSAAIEQAGIAPSQLLLEITETTMMVDHEAVLSMLAVLREIGVRIAIDDFGTGYSSLSYLKDLPVDVLKIDKSFTDDVATESGRALVETINTMASALALDTIAEGVEQHHQIDELVAAGCRFAQGFLFSRPIPPDEIHEWLGSANPVGVSTTHENEPCGDPCL